MDGLRRFAMVDTLAVKVGDLEKNMESRPVVKPKFTDFPEVVVREGADELTRRRQGGALRTSIGTTNVVDIGWVPPLVNEDSRFPRCRGIGMGDHVLQIQGVAPCGQMLKIWRKQEGQGTLVFGRRKGQRNVCLRCGQCAVDPNKIPSKVGSLGNPLEEPDVCSGRRTETCRAQMWAGPVISSERCVMCPGSVS